MAQATALADALDGRPARELATGADGVRAVELAEQASGWCRAASGAPSPAENLSVDAAR